MKKLDTLQWVLLLCTLMISTTLAGQKRKSLVRAKRALLQQQHPWAEKVDESLLILQQSMQEKEPFTLPSARIPTSPIFLTYPEQLAIEIIVTAKSKIPEISTQLIELGAEGVDSHGFLIDAKIPEAKLAQVAVLDGIARIRPVLMPELSSGTVKSQGDTVVFADDLRDISGYDGTGVKIGVISNSYDLFSGAATAVLNKELPGTTNTDFSTPVDVLLDDNTITNNDEGRAMMEIIHDLAPAATLAFHTAIGGVNTFVTAIEDLVTAGCDIIVDDIRYRTSPMFFDGPIAEAVDAAVANGVIYVAAAGNQGALSYEATYVAGDTVTNSGFGMGVIYKSSHVFGGGNDQYQSITVGDGATISLLFQWEDPYTSITGAPGPGSDLDIVFFDMSDTSVINIAGSGTFWARMNLGDDPWELIQYTNNTGVARTIGLMIGLYEGDIPSRIKYVISTDGTVTIDEYDTASSTCYAQANADGAIAVGAADYSNTPEYGVNPPIIQSYSAKGGLSHEIDKNGNVITPITRQKPEIVGPDNVNTSFFGTDQGDADAFPNFAGTSAAAPHIAAIIALLKEAEPTATVAQIRTALQSSAINMDGAGFDYNTGYGLIDGPSALTALQGALPVEWGNISAQPLEKTIQIEWATLSEYNTAYFEVERSADGRTFLPIGQVTAAGTSLERRAYQFSDDTPLVGHNYYQVKQYDLDGTYSYSPVVTAQLKDQSVHWKIFPNPLTQPQLTLHPSHTTSEEWVFELLDSQGKILLKKKLAALTEQSSYSIPLPNIIPGLYFVKLTGNNSVEVISIIK